MPSGSFSIAKEVLNDADLKRMACCFLHCDRGKIDYNAAAADFGSASAASFRVMLSSALKKIETGGGDVKGRASSSAPTTPSKKRASPTKKSGGRKRTKPNLTQEADDEELPAKKEDYDSDEAPTMPEWQEGDVNPFTKELDESD